MIEQVILDVDLTILDSFGPVFAAYRGVAEKLGLPLPREDTLRRLWGKKVPEIIRGLWADVELEMIFPVILSVSRASSIPLIPGVIGVLQQIRQSEKALGLLSTTPRNLFELQLVAAGVELKWFETVVGGGDTDYVKPDPRVFEAFTRVRPASSLAYVGDALVDLEAARGAGLGLFLAVTTGHTSRDDFLAAGVPEIQILDSVVAVPKALGLGFKGI